MIKRTIFIIITILYLLALPSMAFAVDETNNNYQDAYRSTIPKSFTAYGVQFPDTISPYRNLESILEFNFVNKKSIHSSFEFEHSAMYYGYGPSKHKLDFDLTYDKKAFSENDSIFINGTFTYDLESGGEKYFYSGKVIGRYIYTNEENFNSNDTLCCRNFILLVLTDENSDWTLELFLSEPEEFLFVETENYYNEEGYYSDECSPHVPAPSSQTDVAVGVSVSTIVIALINALTKTSPFGSTPFNITFNPNAPIVSPTPSPSATVGSGILNTVKNFFKGLLKNLRDMLTDEGRSYASGKVSDVLDDTNNDSDSTP